MKILGSILSLIIVGIIAVLIWPGNSISRNGITVKAPMGWKVIDKSVSSSTADLWVEADLGLTKRDAVIMNAQKCSDLVSVDINELKQSPYIDALEIQEPKVEQIDGRS